MSKNGTGGKQGRPSTRQPDITHTAPLGDPPTHLSHVGRELWKHIAEHAPWVGEVDRYAVLDLIAEHELRESIRVQIDLGITTVSIEVDKQGKRINPEYTAMKELNMSITAKMRSLGLTPDGRGPITGADNAPSKLDKFVMENKRWS